MVVNNWVRTHPALVGGLLGGAFVGGALYHRKSISRSVCSWRILKSTLAAEKRVFVVSSVEAWKRVEPLLVREATRDGAIGFDCEWVHIRGKRRPVALLQLASSSGICVLVRLCHMKSNIPDSLKELLINESILKVGVGPIEDSNYLSADYNLWVKGSVDLRYVGRHCQLLRTAQSGGSKSVKDEGGMGLNSLAQKYLGRTLDKDWRVRASDWEADTLTKRQVNYAADDALVGIHILMKMVEELWEPTSLYIPLLPSHQWSRYLSEAIHHICEDVVDLKFSKKDQDPGSVPSIKQHQPIKLKVTTGRNGIRKGPLYHNCLLRAPDDKPLCTIDPKKALWYVEKGLGVLVSEEPLIVRLKFEPAGRPQMEMVDGQFYLEERQNICVVCGKEETFIRKNVVPKEYRKYFPETLKAHQNHDVVLLCADCHRLNNMRDQELRFKLADEFDAPIGTEKGVKYTFDKNLKSVRHAAGALLRWRNELPEKRLLELEHTIKKFYGTSEITQDHLEKAYSMDVQIWNDDYIPHGYKVFLSYEKVGLVKLEQRWREFFLSSMKPKHLPKCWSVTHNVFKMHLKMSRLPLNHPSREQYKIVLVGTEGEIDVAYNPDLSRESTPVNVVSTSPERNSTRKSSRDDDDDDDVQLDIDQSNRSDVDDILVENSVIYDNKSKAFAGGKDYCEFSL